MSWLPFICLITGSAILFVAYSRTVGHIHRMVHQLDEAIDLHEERLNAYGDDMMQVAEILTAMSKRIESELKG